MARQGEQARGAGWRLVLLAAAIGLSGSARGQCTASPELEARLRGRPSPKIQAERGTWFGERGRFGCANSAFRASLKLDPRSAKVNYFLGFSLYSGGEKQAALGPLAESSRLDPKALQPLLLRGAILDDLGRRQEAQLVWMAALSLDPNSAEALDGLARSLIESHEYFTAIELLRNAPRNEDLSLDLASAYGSAGMLDDAAATIQQALTATPVSPRLTRALATVYIHQSRYDDARKLWQAWLEAHPGDREAEIQYLGALVLTNDVTAGMPLANKLFAEAPHDFDVLYLKGILEKETDGFCPAAEHLREAVRLQPENWSAQYQLGATLAHGADLAGARTELERSIALSPGQPEAHFQLAGVLRKLGQTAAAQHELEMFQTLKQAGLVRAEAESKAHQAHERLASGDVAQAVELYQQAVAATPGNALLQYQYAMALDEAKKTVEEKAALDRALTLDPTFAIAANQLGYLQTKGGDLSGAEASFRRAVTAAPAFAEAWVNLSATQAAESHFAAAKESVGRALKLEPGNAQARALSERLEAAATQAGRPPG